MDPSEYVYRWCNFCGAELIVSALQVQLERIEPPCPRCRRTDWRYRTEEDEPVPD